MYRKGCYSVTIPRNDDFAMELAVTLGVKVITDNRFVADSDAAIHFDCPNKVRQFLSDCLE